MLSHAINSVNFNAQGDFCRLVEEWRLERLASLLFASV